MTTAELASTAKSLHSKGMSYNQIAAEFKKDGITTPRGKVVSNAFVGYLLHTYNKKPIRRTPIPKTSVSVELLRSVLADNYISSDKKVRILLAYIETP